MAAVDRWCWAKVLPRLVPRHVPIAVELECCAAASVCFLLRGLGNVGGGKPLVSQWAQILGRHGRVGRLDVAPISSIAHPRLQMNVVSRRLEMLGNASNIVVCWYPHSYSHHSLVFSQRIGRYGALHNPYPFNPSYLWKESAHSLEDPLVSRINYLNSNMVCRWKDRPAPWTSFLLI